MWWASSSCALALHGHLQSVSCWRRGPALTPILGDIRAAACQPQLLCHWAVGAEGMALAGLVLQPAPGALFAQGATSSVELLAGATTCAHAGWLAWMAKASYTEPCLHCRRCVCVCVSVCVRLILSAGLL